MDPKIVKEAKQVPERLKDIVTSMFNDSKPALRSGVAGLRQGLGRIEHYLQEVEAEHLGSKVPAQARTKAKATKKAAAKKKVSKRTSKKTNKLFAISEFVLKTLGAGRKPMKPADIAAKLAAAAPGQHRDPAGTVSRTLDRLKNQGTVKRTKSGWRVA